MSPYPDLSWTAYLIISGGIIVSGVCALVYIFGAYLRSIGDMSQDS